MPVSNDQNCLGIGNLSRVLLFHIIV